MYKFLIAIAVFLQGCSVYMAADGNKTPNISKFEQNTTRFDIESVLGEPIMFTNLADNKTQAVYEFEKGNDPSPLRASAWLIADIFSGALAEFILYPYESNKGELSRVKVNYNADDQVINLEVE